MEGVATRVVDACLVAAVSFSLACFAVGVAQGTAFVQFFSGL